MKGMDRVGSPYGLNRESFHIMQEILKIQTNLPVQVKSVSGGGLAPVGYVDAQILVDQIDGFGKSIDHAIIVNLPYFRLQGGANAVVIDPEVGDIGLACFSSRDISVFKNARKKSPPGSWRNHDLSDAFYFGGFLNAAPSQYIQFSSSGIKIYSPTKIDVEAPIVNVNATSASIAASGSASVSAPSVSLGSSGGSLRSLVDSRLIALFNGHTHPGDSGGTTGVPNQTMAEGAQTTTVTKAG